MFRIPNLDKLSLFLTGAAKTWRLLCSWAVILSSSPPPPLVVILVHYVPATKKPTTALSGSKMCILTYKLWSRTFKFSYLTALSVTIVDEWMSIEQWWNDTERGKLKYWKKNPYQWHFVYHKLLIDWPGTEAGTLRWEAGDQPSQPWNGPEVSCSWRLQRTRLVPLRRSWQLQNQRL